MVVEKKEEEDLLRHQQEEQTKSDIILTQAVIEKFALRTRITKRGPLLCLCLCLSVPNHYCMSNMLDMTCFT
jgi:hypothetical protein